MIPGIVGGQGGDEEAEGGFDFANVSLLCSFDGTDGATSTTDDSNYHHTIAFNGNAQLDTAYDAFNDGSSLLCDGTGDYLRIPNSIAFDFGPDPFTIEFFVKLAIVTGVRHIIGVWDTLGGSPEKSWRIAYNQFAGGMTFNYSVDGVNETEQVVGIYSLNTPAHVCIERDTDNNLRHYTNGVLFNKLEGFGADIFTSVKDLTIGMNPDGSTPFSGQIDEVRIVKGQAVYATDDGFTPPTAPYPRS